MNASATPRAQSANSGLTARLIASDVLTEEQAQAASREAKAMEVSLMRHLIDTLDLSLIHI